MDLGGVIEGVGGASLVPGAIAAFLETALPCSRHFSHNVHHVDLEESLGFRV